MTDTEALDQITSLLSESEWNADTLDQIADLILQTERIISDTDPT